ncbi:unnamed protein product [Fusarium venenatum]|uniref:Uncharacterized protein n=1 Tax=Fusarium venenatum TaxID=56646 RepID=A0A2L2SVU1_9HYPO|nr:uncharacterized protein FVRRES_12586 [Fusarium venenatum]CEI39895.1 unnamed protein product [Fusarium venenatum]
MSYFEGVNSRSVLWTDIVFLALVCRPFWDEARCKGSYQTGLRDEEFMRQFYGEVEDLAHNIIV